MKFMVVTEEKGLSIPLYGFMGKTKLVGVLRKIFQFHCMDSRSGMWSGI